MSPKKTSKKAATKKAARKGSKKAAKSASTKGATKAAAKLQPSRAFAATPRLASARVAPAKAQEVKVRYIQTAYKFSAARNKDEIHPRKVLPKPPAGPKIMDSLPTAPLALEEGVPPAAMAAARTRPLAPTDTISLVKNVQLNDVATADTASHVCEPSAAINGNVVFYTGNWFAAVSTNGGTTFKFVDPFTTFPNPPGMSFCCDQVVHYVKSIDTFFWLLQYSRDSTGKNVQRIAFATTARVKTGTWRFFDITPASLGLSSGIWLDFPDLATGTNMLYMTTNAFTTAGSWRASAVVRIRLSSFTSGTLSATRSVSTTHPSLRVAQNCETIAFFVAHNSTSSLRVFKWPEASAAPTSSNVTVASWSSSAYSSITPDGRNWLLRADGRHTGATLAGNELWFAWGSAKGGANARPNPFIQIARINATTMSLIQNINLWDPNSALCYAALGTNANKEVGASYTIGGGTRFPTHVVAILTGTLRQVTTFTGTRGPSDNKWGDYMAVRRNYANQRLFCATGYTLQSGAGSSDATPHLTIFGRSTEI
ncbi:MAG: hypothetical protein ND866_03685 [Pyrinomonadaceae bacterium]|nr:hypothetical protein [Pyrinomonadaceae bacterium]